MRADIVIDSINPDYQKLLDHDVGEEQSSKPFHKFPSSPALQFALSSWSTDLYQCSTIAQTNLSTIDSTRENDLLKSILVLLTRLPDIGDELLPGQYGTCKSSLEFFDVCWIGAAKFFEQRMGGTVP